MIIHEVAQGTPEWHALRANTRNASEAPAMMGVSQYKSRAALVREKATGFTEEVTPEMQRRFDLGHVTEAMARPLVEAMIGEELYPLVATDDQGYLLASSDGSTMLGDTGFEHKTWNTSFASLVEAGEVPDSHKWQLDQQIAVFGFDKIIFVVSDGTPDKFVSCEYRSTPERIAKLVAGWKQFDEDVANYQPEVIEAKPILHAKPIDNLPALFIEVTGRVTSSNLVEFKAAATAVISSIKTELNSDQDFVDAADAVKYLKDVEDGAKRAKQNALDQTASIAELHRALDEVIAMSATVRKALDKKITEEKDKRKEEIVLKARNAMADHCRKLNDRIGGFMPAVSCDFAGAVKGLRSLDSMNEKVGAALRDAQYETSQTADRIEANIKSLVGDDSHSWRFLFPDLMAVCNKEADDFAALLSSRIASHKEAEAKRLEAEREKIRAEEQAKAEAKARSEAQEAAAKAESERLAVEEASKMHDARKERADAYVEAAASMAQQAEIMQINPDGPKVSIPMTSGVKSAASNDCLTTIKLGEICARLGYTVSAEFLASLGFEATTDKNAKLYQASMFPMICRRIADHTLAVAFKKAA